jgi:hypothetical protein
MSKRLLCDCCKNGEVYPVHRLKKKTLVMWDWSTSYLDFCANCWEKMMIFVKAADKA